MPIKLTVYAAFGPLSAVINADPIQIDQRITTVIYREPWKISGWVIAERTTGFALAKGETKNLAIENAKSILFDKTTQQIRAGISAALNTASDCGEFIEFIADGNGT